MNASGLIGIVFRALSGLAGLLIGNKKAKKHRGLDEVHDYLWQKARSYSWYVTLIVIYILLLLVLLGVSLSPVTILSVLLIVHFASWGGTGAILSMKMYEESKATRKVYMFLLTFFIIFAISLAIIIYYLS